MGLVLFMAWALRIVVLLGCALRLFHYIRDPSVWHDEAALLVNVLRLDFQQLLGPLIYHEAAPPLFLWLERAVALTLGDSSHALRLIPIVTACASVICTGWAARALLPPRAALIAVAVIAFSDRLLWHACEAKPYSVDVFLASALFAGWTRLSRMPGNWRCVLLAGLSPVLIFVSYPACFLLGGAMVATLITGLKAQRLWMGLLIWGGVAVSAFALLYFGPIRAQRCGPMDACWVGHFPDWRRPWLFPVWSIAGAFEVFRYNFMPLGAFLLPVAIMGTVRFVRNGTLDLPVLGWMPMLLAWLAACVHGYPFGGSRVEAFLAPGLALLIGSGAETLLERSSRSIRCIRIAGVIVILVVVGFGLRTTMIDWPRADIYGASRYILDQPDDDLPVFVNHWEYDYYFRASGDRLHYTNDGLPATTPRLWLALTAPDVAIRERLLRDLVGTRAIVRRLEFKFTTVLLVEQRSPLVRLDGRSTPPHIQP